MVREISGRGLNEGAVMISRRAVHVPSVTNAGPVVRVTSARFAMPGPGSMSTVWNVAVPLKPLSTCDQAAPPLVDL